MFGGKDAGPDTGNGDVTGVEDRAERARVTEGQRSINKIWEYTQAFIASSVVIANLVVGVHIGLFHDNSNATMPAGLSNPLFLVVGFYFGRGNHTAIGGVGGKPHPPYQGR